MKKVCGVYLIINTENGKIYVGSAAHIFQRWKHHVRFLNLNRHHNILLQRSWNKYGEDCFHFCIVEECLDIFLSAGSIWFMIDTIWNITHWSD